VNSVKDRPCCESRRVRTLRALSKFHREYAIETHLSRFIIVFTRACMPTFCRKSNKVKDSCHARLLVITGSAQTSSSNPIRDLA